MHYEDNVMVTVATTYAKYYINILKSHDKYTINQID